MSGLCGWFRSEHAGTVDPRVIAAMAGPLNCFDGSTVRSAFSGFGAVAAAGAGVSVLQEDERLVAGWGSARFCAADPPAPPPRPGVARPLAPGHPREGPGVLTGRSGARAPSLLAVR